VEKLRVLVAEDHDVIRAFVVASLSKEFQVVGDVGDGEQLVEAALLFDPDVIVSDIAMPFVDGLLAREQLLAKGIQVPFVFMAVLDMARLPPNVVEGAVGFVHKMDVPNELSLAIRAVAAGRSYLSRSFRAES
jgi:two-component system response regulator NreC